jgi:predicted membrane channel-forming protein YqfA (hemolysin III family)
MDYVINYWTSIPENARYQIVMISWFLVPSFIVILCNYDWAEIIIGAFAFLIPVCVETYLQCSDTTQYCTDDDFEPGVYIFIFFVGLIYCLFVKFVYLSIKNFFIRNR